MEWWQILIIVFVAGIFLDNMVSNISKAIASKNEQKDNNTER